MRPLPSLLPHWSADTQPAPGGENALPENAGEISPKTVAFYLKELRSIHHFTGDPIQRTDLSHPGHRHPGQGRRTHPWAAAGPPGLRRAPGAEVPHELVAGAG